VLELAVAVKPGTVDALREASAGVSYARSTEDSSPAKDDKPESARGTSV
jgi:hypothetical protein